MAAPLVARFGFVVHPLTSFQRRLLGVRDADSALILGRASRRPPGRLISEMRLELATGQVLQGCLTAIPTLPEALLNAQERAVEDILDAVRLCNGAGATVVGLGAVTAVVGGQGRAVAEAAPCGVTSGNALTAWAAVETWRRYAELCPTRRRTAVGLFGLPGAVASGILHLLVRSGVEVHAVVSRASAPLQRTFDRLNREGPGSVRTHEGWRSVFEAGLVLVAASSTGRRIPLSALPHGAVVIDVAEPVDLDEDVPPREDVLVMDGEMVRLPGVLRGTEPWQTLYGLVTGQRDRIFACFAEPMLLAATGRPELAGCGRELPLERLLALGELAHRHRFVVDELCSRGRPIRRARLLAFAERDRS